MSYCTSWYGGWVGGWVGRRRFERATARVGWVGGWVGGWFESYLAHVVLEVLPGHFVGEVAHVHTGTHRAACLLGRRRWVGGWLSIRMLCFWERERTVGGMGLGWVEEEKAV